MADYKQVLVLEFKHTPDGLKLEEVKDISTRDSITVSQSRSFSKEQVLPIINIENTFKPQDHHEEQAPRTLVIKVAGTTSAVITF
ncbi:MAG: hypothetical protein ACOY4Q_04805 [Bacillota bacterium]